MSLSSKLDRATLRPFPVDRIVVPHYELDATTYDARIPVQNILLHAGRKELVVRPACDACVAKKVHCNRDGRQCAGCKEEDVECDWVSKQWEKLPGPQNGGKHEVKQKRAYTRKAKVAPADGDGDGDEPADAPKKAGRKQAAASASTTGKRKRAADDEAPEKETSSKRSKKKEELKAHIVQFDQELAAIRAAAKIATPEWETPPQLARKHVVRRTGRSPPLWAESLQDVLDILPRYKDRTTDGIVAAWDALLLGVGGTAHPDDRWLQDGVLELSFVRKFTKLPEPAPPDAPRRPQADAPPIVRHPPSADPVPTNIVHPPRLPTPPLAPDCPLLSPPDEITMLLRLFANRIPVLVLLSAASPLRPPCKIPDDGVLWLGYFGVESVEEDYPVPPVLGKKNWKGTKRWKIRLRWCFHESMDGEGATRPWFVPRPPTQTDEIVPSQPAPRPFAGYPQLAGVAPPDPGSPHEDKIQIDPALSGAGVSAVQHGIENLQVAAPEPPHRPSGSFVPANYPLVPLPRAVHVPEPREGDAPKGWCCPCGRLNIRRWLNEWDCASCSRTAPIRPLHARAVRPKWDIRSPVIDLEVAAHARGAVPPVLEGWDDGSALMRYPAARACHVVPALARDALDRAFEALQTAPRAFGRGVPVADDLYFGGAPGREERRGVKVSRGAWSRRPVPMFGRVVGPRHSMEPDLPALRDVREWMDFALGLAADASEPHADAEPDAVVPTTAGKTLFGLVWLEELKAPFQIRLPTVDPILNLTALALGANVLLSLPGRPRQAPKPRDNMKSLPKEFVVNLAHGDVFVLDELAAGEKIGIKSEGPAMLLVCY